MVIYTIYAHILLNLLNSLLFLFKEQIIEME